VVDVAEFLRATKTASIFARDGSGIVRIVVGPGADTSPGKVTISARSEELGDNTVTSMPLWRELRPRLPSMASI